MMWTRDQVIEIGKRRSAIEKELSTILDHHTYKEGNKNANAFTPEVEQEITDRYALYESCHDLAVEYHCTPKTISNIAHRHGYTRPKGHRSNPRISTFIEKYIAIAIDYNEGLTFPILTKRYGYKSANSVFYALKKAEKAGIVINWHGKATEGMLFSDD